VDDSTLHRQAIVSADDPTLRRRAIVSVPRSDHAEVGTKPDTDDTNPPESRQWEKWLSPGIFLVLLLGAIVIHLYHLNHLYITAWDESVHANVAEHLEQHPLVPTLYEIEAIPVPLTQWASVHIWLHILPFGMWAVALTMKFFGDTPLALRLPGVIFMIIGMVSTYFLGKRLFKGPSGDVVGIVGAFFIGFAPYSIAVGQGYAFGDMTDTPLIGLTPLLLFAAVKGWQTGKLRWLIVAGVVQGCLYLSKGALGLAPVAVVAALFLGDWILHPEEGWSKPGWRGLAAFFGATILAILPFYIYFNMAFPQTMAVENNNWKKAFFTNYEGWGAPLDFHITVNLYALYGTAIAFLLLFSVLLTGWLATSRHSRADLVIFVSVVAIYLPISIAVSKAPTMGVAAMGAFGLAAGRLISLMLFSHERIWQAIGVGVIASAVGMGVLLMTGHYHHLLVNYDLSPSMIEPSGDLHLIVDPKRRNALFIEFFLAAFTAAFIWILFDLVERAKGDVRWRRFANLITYQGSYRFVGILFLAGTLTFLTVYIMSMDIAFVARPAVDPGPAPVIGPYLAQHTTPNTTIFIADAAINRRLGGHDNLMVMFWAHRDTYSVARSDAKTLCPLIQQAETVSSPVVLVTHDPYAGTPIGTVDGWSVYPLSPCGSATTGMSVVSPSSSNLSYAISTAVRGHAMLAI
jgi:hypothetical protein